MYVFNRSWVYRLWVLGGIAGIAAFVVRSGLTAQPGDEAPVESAIALVAIWVAGLLGLTWARLIADRREGAYGLGTGPARTATGGALPADPAELMAALALRPVAPADVRRRADQTWSFTLRGFGLITALGLATAAGGLLHVNGVDAVIQPFETGPGLPVAFTPVVAIVLIGLVRLRGQVEAALEIGDDWLEPLGLRTHALPASVVTPDSGGGLSHRLTGATVMAGRRHGHGVHVEVAAGASRVALATATAPFKVVSDGGVLRAVDGAPEWVAAAAAAAGRDARFGGVRIAGGPEGIVVERRRGGDGWGWLVDLWLAERLAVAAPAAA